MGNFTFEKCGEIEGLYLIQPKVFGDNRGYFMETYNYNAFKEAGLDMVFVQDNQSSSTKGVLRGLHYQKNHTQGKLVRVLSGEVFDVAVDIRRGSKTYGKWFGVTLTQRRRTCSIFRKALLTASMYCLIQQSLHISVRTFMILLPRQALCGMMRRSV